MIKIGIIGCGFMGKMHANCYRVIEDSKVISVYDIRRDSAEEVAEISGAKVCRSPEELLDSEVTVVDICVPTFLHKEYVIKALVSNKDVICEKPFALNLAQAESMLEKARERKRKFAIAMVVRFWPEYLKIKEIIKSKKYGKLVSVNCTRLSGHPEYAWEKWFSDSRKSGSAALDLHIHDTDFIYHVLGMPSLVSSYGRKTHRGYEHIWTYYKYKDVNVFAEGGWDLDSSFGFVQEIRCIFEDGTSVVFNSKYQPLIIYGKNKVEKINIEKISNKTDSGGNISELGGYYNELKYWIECLKENKRPVLLDAEDAINSFKIVLKEIESMKKNREMKL